MFVLVLNQSNLVQDGQNNKLIYKFPNSVILTHKYIAVSSVTMYYSWFNITSALGNNVIQYTYGQASVVYTITIPDGLYEITDINNYCQFAMIANNTYSFDANFNYYPFDLYVNPTRYAVQLNTYPTLTVANATAAGRTYPAGVPPLPATTADQINSVVVFPPNFSSIVGYPVNFTSVFNQGNTYVPPTPSAANNYVTKSPGTAPTDGILSYLSNVAPQVQPNSNLLINLSNINNPYSQPSGIIYSLTPSVAIGEVINDRPPNFMWNKMIDGTYNSITLSFLGSNLQPLTIRDPQMTILLTIRDKDEAFLGSK